MLVIDYMTQILPVRTIGPTILSMYLDKRLQNDKEYGLNAFQPMADACITWLNERSEESVVCVIWKLGCAERCANGRIGMGIEKQQQALHVGGEKIGKLPNGFVEETTQKGLVVSWCPQLQVFAHKSIGCFLTHCGWNSTLEALSLGVPMIAMPQWTDQTTNAKFVTDVWKLGIKAQSDSDGMNGIVKRDVIEKCIRQVMEGKRGEEFRTNATKWKELAKKAVDERGSLMKTSKSL